MHYAVCSIVCAVSLRLCPTLSQYLFSLITMGACCGCLDGFFGRLLFRSAAFVFRHWLPRVLFVCLRVCARAVPIRADAQAKTEVRRSRTSREFSVPAHMMNAALLSCLPFIWTDRCWFQIKRVAQDERFPFRRCTSTRSLTVPWHSYVTLAVGVFPINEVIITLRS